MSAEDATPATAKETPRPDQSEAPPQHNLPKASPQQRPEVSHQEKHFQQVRPGTPHRRPHLQLKRPGGRIHSYPPSKVVPRHNGTLRLILRLFLCVCRSHFTHFFGPSVGTDLCLGSENPPWFSLTVLTGLSDIWSDLRFMSCSLGTRAG